MPRRDLRCAEAVGDDEELVELHPAVARRARARRLPGEVGVDERRDHGALEELAPVEGVVGKAELVGRAPRVVLVFGRAAAAMPAHVLAVVPEVQGDADDLVPLVDEARGGHGGVDPSAHGDDDAAVLAHAGDIALPRPLRRLDYDGRMTSSLEKTAALILAAGQGTRMKSAMPKALHPICGRPLIHYPVRAALEAGCGEVVVVVGHGRTQVQDYLADAFPSRVRTAVQEHQRGTGDAARAGIARVSPLAERVLIFYGDGPLISSEDVAKIARALDDPEVTLALATCTVADPQGYGRVLRDAKGEVVEIREQKDLRGDAERAVTEINPGIYAASIAFFREALATLQPNNAQGELYLTDIVAFAKNANERIAAIASRADVLVGVNDRRQLAAAEEMMHRLIVDRWRIAGATVRDGARIDDGVELGEDVTVEAGAVLRGATRVGRGAVIDTGSVLTNAVIEAGAAIKPYCVITDSKVGPRAQIGPFSHLRPASDIGEDAHVGNFVETKKTRMAKGAKANHLAYLGDGVIGERANVGAGTIFCNYDGFLKHTTIIEADAFIGSDSQIVAPVTVGKGAYVATGTTVTRDVPANALAIARPKQENKEEYATKLRAKLRAAKDAKGK